MSNHSDRIFETWQEIVVGEGGVDGGRGGGGGSDMYDILGISLP